MIFKLFPHHKSSCVFTTFNVKKEKEFWGKEIVRIALEKYDMQYGGSGFEDFKASWEEGMSPEQALLEDLSYADD